MARSHHETEEEALFSPGEKPQFYDRIHLTREGFLKAFKNDPDKLYEALSGHIKALEETNQAGILENINLRSEIENLQQELGNEDAGVKKLAEELAVKDNRILELTTERNILRKAISCMNLKSTTPSARSAKLPDPPMLTDGNDPAFENWLSKMEGKLEANKDHFETEAMRMAYIESRTGGNAAKHLGPRLRATALDRFTTGHEMLVYLSTIYEDPNKVHNAKYGFRRLYQGPNEDFHDFLTKFLHLAGESQLSKVEYKYELNSKLSSKLRPMVYSQYGDPSVDFHRFSSQCSQAALAIKEITASEARQARYRFPSSNANTSTELNASKTSTSKTTTLIPNKEPLSAGKLALMKEGKCFYCKGAGHRVFECPVRSSKSINAVEEDLTERTEDLKVQP